MSDLEKWLDENGIEHARLNFQEARNIPISFEDIATIGHAIELALEQKNLRPSLRERFLAFQERLSGIAKARLREAIEPRDTRKN